MKVHIRHVGARSAFPLPADIAQESTGGLSSAAASGLTKRELFAAMAMQGLFSDNDCNWNHDRRAAEAVEAADALLRELAKEATER